MTNEQVTNEQPWYGVRTVLTWEWFPEGSEADPDRPFRYEERVTVWPGARPAEVVEAARAEGTEYAATIEEAPSRLLLVSEAGGPNVAPEQQAEVFRAHRVSGLAPEDYLDAYFDTGAERTRDVDDPEPSPSADSVRLAAMTREPSEHPGSQWYGVRTHYLQTADRSSPSTHVYLERITLWLEPSADAAIARAEVEATDYVGRHGGRYLEYAQSYELAEDPGRGVEVYSLLRDSALGPDAYVERFFAD